MAEPPSARRTLGPVVVLGLAAGLLVALGGNRPWAALVSASADLPVTAPGTTSATAPLAGALGYVVLAAWGVLLVTRGRVRRGVAVLALLAAVGALVTWVAGYWTADDTLRAALAQADLEGEGTRHTAWFWITGVAAAVGVLATSAAVRLAPTWPEMGSRYDAPGSEATVEEAEDPTSLDLWRALDEGHDPTVRPDARRDP